MAFFPCRVSYGVGTMLLNIIIVSIAFAAVPRPAQARSTTRSTCAWSPRGSPYPFEFLSTGTCPSSSSSLLPWSHAPFCPAPTDPNIGGEDPDDCVFTYASFRGNQGLSLITSPDLATSIAAYLDDSGVQERYRNHPSSPQAPPSQTARKPEGYAIRKLRGRGLGVVATRAYARHETVMIGHPALLVRFDYLNSDRFDARAQGRMLERAVRQLPEETRNFIYHDLAKSTGGEPIRDAIRTNAFGVEIEGVNHMALFLEGSRVNHGCRPNVFWRYSYKDMAMEIVALRPIQAGDEILHSYAPLGYTMQERQSMLQPWGFQCRCSMCTAHPHVIAESDSRRERMFEVHSTLSMAIETSSLSKARIDAIVKEALQIIEIEELDPQLVEYHQLFAKAYMSINEVASARKHIAAAEAKWIYYEGEEHSNIEGLKKLWQDLKDLEEAIGEDED